MARLSRPWSGKRPPWPWSAVVGVPLGMVTGRAIWDAFSDNLGAAPVAVVPIAPIAGLVAGIPGRSESSCRGSCVDG